MRLGPLVIERRRTDSNGKRELAEQTVAQQEYREFGASSPGSSYSGMVSWEYNPDLRGQRGINVYDKMRKGDAQARAILRVVKAPILSAQWFVESYSDAEIDEDAAALVRYALFNMSREFKQILSEALLMLDFGYYPFEKVFEDRQWRPPRKGANTRTIATWKKWGPRHPKNTVEWKFDDGGGVQALIHSRSDAQGRYDEVPIPIEKLLIFTLDEEAGNPEGVSLLRSAYAHWYYKHNLYKVDAIQKERHGIGIPRAKLPPNYTPKDFELAKQMVEHLRTNERARLVVPPGLDVDFVKPEGMLVDVLKSAQHHDLMMARSILAQFLNLGGTEEGSRAISTAQQDLFMKAIRYIADLVRGVINKWAIPQLVGYNYDVDHFPELKIRRLGDVSDLRAIAVAMNQLVDVGAITPDDEFENFLREIFDFPHLSPAISRSVEERLPDKKEQGRPRETEGT